MCSMTITILLSRRIIRSVPLLKGKKAEAPSLPDDPPIGLHAHGFLQLPLPPLIDRPFVHPFKKGKKEKRKRIEERPLSSFGKKFVAAPLLEFKLDTKPFEGEDGSTPVKNCWYEEELWKFAGLIFRLLKYSPVIFNFNSWPIFFFLSFFQRSDGGN